MADQDQEPREEPEQLYGTVLECSLLSHIPMGMPIMPIGKTHFWNVKYLLRKHNGWYIGKPERCDTTMNLMFYTEEAANNFFHDYTELMNPRLMMQHSDGMVII